MDRNVSIYTMIKMGNNAKNTHSTTSPETKQPQTTYQYPLLIIMAFSIS